MYLNVLWICNSVFDTDLRNAIMYFRLAVFHKSKQSLTKATLKKLSKTINCTEVSFLSNEQLCGVMVTG